jgi:phosphoserine phosphatase
MTGKKSPSSVDREALERILEVTRQLARPLDLHTLLELVVNEGRAVLQADRGTVFLYDPQPDELYTTVATGTETFRIPAGRGIVGECARTRQLVNVPDCYADPRFNRDVDKKTGYRTRCLLTVPLIGHDDSLVGVFQLLNKLDGVFTAEDEELASALAAQCAVALQRARMLEDLVAKEKMAKELAVAREIQQGVLPDSMPDLEDYDIAGWCRPADETGGDIFDIIPAGEDRLVLLLGDATGHGVGPALSVTQVRSMLRMCVRHGVGLDEAFRHINDQLSEDLATNRFVTAFLGTLDTRGHRMEYHAGGQAPILHFHAASGEFESLDSSTVPMGVMGGLPPPSPRVYELQPGDMVAVMTDGFFEYENPAEEQFGEARVQQILRTHGQEPMEQVVQRIVDAVEAFSEGAPQADDMTILLVKRR